MALDIIKVKHFYNKWGYKSNSGYEYLAITESVEEQLNKFLTENKITPYEYIDIKYNEVMNKETGQLEPSALLIYKEF